MDAWHCVMSYDKIVFMAFSAYLFGLCEMTFCEMSFSTTTARKGPWIVAPNRIGHARCKKKRLTHVYVACLLGCHSHLYRGILFPLTLCYSFYICCRTPFDDQCELFFQKTYHLYFSIQQFLSVFSFTLGAVHLLICLFLFNFSSLTASGH